MKNIFLTGVESNNEFVWRLLKLLRSFLKLKWCEWLKIILRSVKLKLCHETSEHCQKSISNLCKNILVCYCRVSKQELGTKSVLYVGDERLFNVFKIMFLFKTFTMRQHLFEQLGE